MHETSSQETSRRVEIITRVSAKLGIALALIVALGATSLSFAPAAHASSVFSGECTVGTPALTDMYVDTTEYLFIAWVGCDSAHHLNVEGSTNGSNWGSCGIHYCNKQTLGAVSSLGPGIALATWNGKLYLSYVGTDNHIHVGWYNWTTTLQSDTWLSETTTFTPALTSHLVNGSYKLYLAWTGTDSAHHLNFEYSTNGTGFTGKVTADDRAAAGPGLVDWAQSPAGWQMYVAWMATDSINSLCVGYYTQGSTSLGNHHCLQDCLNSTCNNITTVGDVGLAVDGSSGRLYIGYHGSDWADQFFDATALVLADSSDGYNFHYYTMSDVSAVDQVGGTSITYHSSSIWQAWKQAASGGQKVWTVGVN